MIDSGPHFGAQRHAIMRWFDGIIDEHGYRRLGNILP